MAGDLLTVAIGLGSPWPVALPDHEV